jgi:aminoglycoside 3-N-acetyltransferase I
MESLSTTFGEAFDDTDTYTAHRPSVDYLRRLLGTETFIALAAL